MHLLYAVTFTVTSETVNVPDTLLQHVADWLTFGFAPSVEVEDFAEEGRIEQTATAAPPAGTPAIRTTSWERIESDAAWSVRLTVQQQLDSGITFRTRVTVSAMNDTNTLRIGMSRQYPEGTLVPVRNTPVYQPSLVQTVASNHELQLNVDSQPVAVGVTTVRTEDQVAETVATLQMQRRLPVLVVHARSADGWDVAKWAARKLVGLLEVRVVTFAARAALHAALPEVRIPFGGAVLLWPDLAAASVEISGAALVDRGREFVRALLMGRVAPLAALARGIDEEWRAIRSAEQTAARDDVKNAVEAARTAMDAVSERDALRRQVEVLQQDMDEAEQTVKLYRDDAAKLQAAVADVETAQREADYWKNLYLSTGVPASEEDIDPWEHIPVLPAGANPVETFLALTDAAAEKIVFTRNAERSWKRITYPDPNDMTAQLTVLARAAVRLYDEDAPAPTGHLDNWFKTEFGLNVSMTDDTVKKDKGLRYFEYEGLRYDQQAHVKVRDAVKPNEVGRIHFTLDKVGRRVIINHVALKLYGI